MNKLEEIKKDLESLITSITKDAEEFYDKENKAAGLRLRKKYKAMKAYFHTLTKETLETK